MLLQSLWAHRSFAHVDLDGLVSWVSSLHYPWLLQAFCLLFLRVPLALRKGICWRNPIQGCVLRPLTLFIMSACLSLYLFPPIAGGSFSAESWTRHWPMSRAELLLRVILSLHFGYLVLPLFRHYLAFVIDFPNWSLTCLVSSSYPLKAVSGRGSISEFEL